MFVFSDCPPFDVHGSAGQSHGARADRRTVRLFMCSTRAKRCKRCALCKQLKWDLGPVVLASVRCDHMRCTGTKRNAHDYFTCRLLSLVVSALRTLTPVTHGQPSDRRMLSSPAGLQSKYAVSSSLVEYIMELRFSANDKLSCTPHLIPGNRKIYRLVREQLSNCSKHVSRTLYVGWAILCSLAIKHFSKFRVCNEQPLPRAS